MFIVNKKENNGQVILIITDKDILNKEFNEDRLHLDLRQKFYLGKEMNEEEVKELVKSAYILHLTGKKAVQLGLNLELVDGKNVLIIKGVPHAEVVVED